jgi:hypothetical protein
MKEYQEDIANIYENVIIQNEPIEEGKSGHGDKKIVIDMMKDGIKNNLISVKDTNHGWMVRSIKDPSKQELIHRGEKAFHYLRRFMAKYC